MRLLVARALAARTLLAAAAVTATVTTVLLTAFLLYAQLLPVAGARAAISDAPAAQRALLLTSSAAVAGSSRPEPVRLPARDAAVRELFGAGLAGTPLAVSAGGYATSQRLPDDLPIEPGRYGAYAVVGYLPELADHAELVGGAWPEPVPAGQPVQAALPAALARELELAIGDRVGIVDERGEAGPAPVMVTGLWQPVDPAAGYWRLLAAPVTGEDRWGPFVVHPDEFAARYLTGATLTWVAVPDPADLAVAGPDQVRGGLASLTGELSRRQAAAESAADTATADQAGDPRFALDSSARITTGLGELADRLEVATVVNRSGLVLPAALLAVIAGYGLVLVARLLDAHRQGQDALLRARGASRRQLFGLAAGEAALVVAPAVILAPRWWLHTMGLSGRQASGLLLVELLPPAAAAAVVGALTGAVLPALIGPALGLAELSGGS